MCPPTWGTDIKETRRVAWGRLPSGSVCLFTFSLAQHLLNNQQMVQKMRWPAPNPAWHVTAREPGNTQKGPEIRSPSETRFSRWHHFTLHLHLAGTTPIFIQLQNLCVMKLMAWTGFQSLKPRPIPLYLKICWPTGPLRRLQAETQHIYY